MLVYRRVPLKSQTFKVTGGCTRGYTQVPAEARPSVSCSTPSVSSSGGDAQMCQVPLRKMVVPFLKIGRQGGSTSTVLALCGEHSSVFYAKQSWIDGEEWPPGSPRYTTLITTPPSQLRNVNTDGSLNITDAYEDTTTCKQFEARSPALFRSAVQDVVGLPGHEQGPWCSGALTSGCFHHQT